MLLFLLALAGFAFLDSLDMLLVGVTTAVVFDSRLGRRSPLPGALSFLAGVFAVTTTFGITFVLGLRFLTNLVSFDITPTMRYWAELLIGAILLLLGSVRLSKGGGDAPVAPPWALEARRKPLLLALVGIVIGLAQSPTAVPYLAALTMISARDPHPPLWPLIIVIYCGIALLPPTLILLTSLIPSTRARKFYRSLIRALKRLGPMSIRILLLLAGVALITDALIHHTVL